MSSTAAKKFSTKKKQESHAQTPLHEQMQQLRVATMAQISAGDDVGAIDMLLDIIAAQHQDNERLTKHLNAAIRARFGRRSEKLTAEELGQLVLALGGTEQDAAQADASVPVDKAEEEDIGTDTEKPSKGDKQNKGEKPRHPGRTRLDPALARRITLHTVPEAERDCIHCGKRMTLIGHVEHERVEYIPARIEVAVDRREKIACVGCRQDITTAPRPGACKADAGAEHAATGPGAEQQIEPGEKNSLAAIKAKPSAVAGSGAHVYRRAGASLLAHLLEAKCDDAMPVYRQRQQLARLGFDIPLNTLYSYWDAASSIVEPVAQIILSCVLGKAIVGVDDTRLNWLDPKRRGKPRRGHLWCFVGDGGLVAFEFTESWKADEVAPWIDAIDGYIQCDAYGGYSAMRLGPDDIKVPVVPSERRLGCWMHTRRPFHAAFKAGEKPAVIGLKYIKEIYSVEREARDGLMKADQRLMLRQQKSLPLARQFFSWVEERSKLERPNSYLGQAYHYALAQKEFLMRCLSDGRFELDTGRVERQIREPVIGRKNYLFSGSADAARRLAGVYALVCSCQNLGINTRAYLTDIITKLQGGFPLRDINDLRPDVWAAKRRALAPNQLVQ